MSTQRCIQNSDSRLVRPMRQTHTSHQAQSENLADVPGEQKYKLEDSSTTSGRIELESGLFESAGRDKSNGIRLEVVACL